MVTRAVVAGLGAVLATALFVPTPTAIAQQRPPAGDPARIEPGRTEPAALLPAPPGTTRLVSKGINGGPAGGASAEPSISSSGRWVAFTSAAADLVTGDTNGALDVFVLDRRSGTITRAPILGGARVPAGASASEPSISGDGRIVAFTYQPPPSFAGAVVGTVVLAWDRQTGKVTVVSKTTKGTAAGGSRQPSASSDGRFIAYTSRNPSIVPEDEEQDDVFRFDRLSGRTDLMSVSPTGGPIAGLAASPSISGDGNLVAFLSDGGDSIVFENTGIGLQAYARDVAAGVTERVTTPVDGGAANGAAGDLAISADGRFVAFQSAATNLVAGEGSGAAGLFRRDLLTKSTSLVSLTPDGTPADGTSGQPSITSDGAMVAFASTSTNLVPGIVPAAAAPGRTEVYVRDIEAGQTVLVSIATDGTFGGSRSLSPAIGGRGRFVAFASLSPVLIDKDANKVSDVFLRDLPPVPVVNPPVLDLGGRAVGTESLPQAAVLANAGWSPLAVTGASVSGAAKTEFRIVFDGCKAKVLKRGEACTVSVTFKPSIEGNRTASLDIADDFTGSPRKVRLIGTASLARLQLDPPIGPPGVVVVATGSGFPPGAEVRLSWSLGITPRLGPVITDATGRFRVQVLVFHNDRRGRRELVAEPASASDFPPVGAPMLVTQPPAVPAGFEILNRLIDIPLMLVIRG